MDISLNSLAEKVAGEVWGDGSIVVQTLSPLDEILPNSLVYAEDSSHFECAKSSSAVAILTSYAMPFCDKPTIRVEHPKHVFLTLLSLFYPKTLAPQGVHKTAIIEENVSLGEGITIGPYTVVRAGTVLGKGVYLHAHVIIGNNVVVGADTHIHPNVTVYDDTEIGERVTIHAGSVVGSDGFGYVAVEGKHLKMPHVGSVVIEDDVEIGANTTIDRAALGKTVIGQGTKIDNLVQIAHSVKLGAHNLLCAFTGIAGSTVSGEHVIFAADVGVGDHVRIGDRVILGARTGVPSSKHLKSGNVYLGNPARPKEKALEHELGMTRLPMMRKRLKALALKVEELAACLATNQEES